MEGGQNTTTTTTSFGKIFSAPN